MMAGLPGGWQPAHPSQGAPCVVLGGPSSRGQPDCACAAGRAKEEGVTVIVQVIVRDNNIDQALRALKKKMQREGVFREMKLRRHFEKPSERKARERAEAVRRARKLLRKRMEREGY